MDNMQKIRFKQRLKPVIVLGLLGFGYYIWLLLTDLKIPCIFNKVTGYLCPGCGITRMIMAVLRFDFKNAIEFNPALFFLLPFLGIAYLVETYRYIKIGEHNKTVYSKITIYVSCVVLLVFGILRNIL